MLPAAIVGRQRPAPLPTALSAGSPLAGPLLVPYPPVLVVPVHSIETVSALQGMPWEAPLPGVPAGKPRRALLLLSHKQTRLCMMRVVEFALQKSSASVVI